MVNAKKPGVIRAFLLLNKIDREIVIHQLITPILCFGKSTFLYRMS